LDALIEAFGGDESWLVHNGSSKTSTITMLDRPGLVEAPDVGREPSARCSQRARCSLFEQRMLIRHPELAA
jgi:hypothetical protein